MVYTLTPANLASITDVEAAFSTDRLLPSWEEIPEDFKIGNLYTQLVSAIFYDYPLPDSKIEMKNGFEPTALNRAVRAHIGSFGSKHEHKIAGVGYMISLAATLQ